MSIKKYEVFLKTVDLGSVTKASEVLGYTQSAISHIIASLEDELGIKLLTRGRSGVKLTEEGKKLTPAIRSICMDNQELLRQISEYQGLEVGTIRVGTILSVSVHILPQIIQGFSQQHPNIKFELLQGNYDDMTQWINEGKIDCGFLRLPTSEQFDHISIVHEKFLAIFPKDRVFEHDTFQFEDIQHEPYILRPDTLDEDLSKALRKAGYRPKITYSAKDDYAVMAMVEQGLGMSILPELLMKGNSFQLTTKELEPPIYREICLAFKQLHTLPPAPRKFINYIKKLYA